MAVQRTSNIQVRQVGSNAELCGSEEQVAQLLEDTSRVQIPDTRPQNGEGESEYLCYFMHRFLSFRNAEIDALASACGLQFVRWRAPAGGNHFSPLWYARLPSEEVAQSIAARSILLKSFYELWGEGSSFEAMAADIQSRSSHLIHRYGHESISWKIIVDSWGGRLSQAEQVAVIEKLAFLAFKGPIRLKEPDVLFRVIITTSSPASGLPENITPDHWYFGREVAVSNRQIISRYALPERAYIGPTSMDTEMAFVMCNMARVQKGHFVYDPFVGTGSILVAASHFGAVTIGADIDIRVVRDGHVVLGGQVVDNWTNFQQYKLRPPAGLLRMDAHVPALRAHKDGLFDAIVTDPPYGVRAGGRRSLCLSETGVASKTGQQRAQAENGYPGTKGYTLTECLLDLLSLAATHMRIGGRLVYFLPAAPSTCEGVNVPQHPALSLIANCEQVLTSRYSRRLIVMEKVKALDINEVVPPIDPQIEADLARLSNAVWESRDVKSTRPKFRGKLC